MSQPEHDAAPASPPTEENRRKKLIHGMVILAAVGLGIALWMNAAPTGPVPNQQLEAFAAARPEVVAIGGSNAPVITSDDVVPSFFSLNDMATPAETRIAITPLFDRAVPKHVWLFADSRWAENGHNKELAGLIDDLKARNVATTLILPPQNGETADEVIDTLARISNDKSVAFLDYHDAEKLGAPLCAGTDGTVDAATSDTLNTQQMLLHMAINAPATRPLLKLADIGARIEKIQADAGCGTATAEPTAEITQEEAVPAE